jgi:hypothetical protein
MALAGKLKDVPAAEILQFLAMSGKSGKLTFTTGTEEGLIVFREGMIIYAASSSIRETLGSIMISMGLVSEDQLADALRQQHKTGEDKRLGTILVENKALETKDLQKVLHQQVLNVLREMFSWQSGFFRFRALTLEDQGEVEVDARDLVVEHPLDARRVALDAARQHDEDLRDHPDTFSENAASPSLLSQEDDDEEPGPQATGLKDVMSDFVAPSVTAETVREVFNSASRVFDRGVIFAVQSHGIRGIAQFGLAEGDEAPSQRVRRLWLPVDKPSVISSAVTTTSPYRGSAERNRWNEVLFEFLGGDWPDESVAIPVVIDGRTTVVFYGDNEPHDLPIGSTTDLEETLRQVGEALALGAGE